VAFLNMTTVSSLRRGFLFVGVIGIVAQSKAVSPESDSIPRNLALVGMAIALGYICAGFALPSLLRSARRSVEILPLVGALYSVSQIGAILVVSPPVGVGSEMFARGMAGLFLSIILYWNMRRFAREQPAAVSPT
jgi:hypothetical protein